MIIFFLLPLQTSELLSYTSVSKSPFPFSVERVRREAKGAARRECLQGLEAQKLISQRLLALGGPWRNAQRNCQIALQMYSLPRESAKKSITICANPLHWAKGEGGFY